jgi:hypothetical protein
MPALSRPLLGAARLGPSYGIWAAATAFVPTFLTIVFGIPYLAGRPMASRAPVDFQRGTPSTVAARAPESSLRGAPPNGMPPEVRAMRPVGLADAPARLAATPTGESLGDAAVPVTPSAILRPVARPTPAPIELNAVEPRRSAPPVTTPDTWAHGPAFASRDSAEHFAARMERLGFPADVRRQDKCSPRWAVWIRNPKE